MVMVVSVRMGTAVRVIVDRLRPSRMEEMPVRTEIRMEMDQRAMPMRLRGVGHALPSEAALHRCDHERKTRDSKAQQIRLHTGSTGVATSSRHRGLLAVPCGELADFHGRDLFHG